jgi:ferredoxin--NADP+ reductase
LSKLRLAVIGSGPAGIYASDLILKSEKDFEVSIDLFDSLPAPYGLVRYGVAPDHPRIKGIIKALYEVLDRGDIQFFGNVTYGVDISLDELKDHYHAVIFATGAIKDAALNVPGVDLAGSYGAADFVNWYDAHPDFPLDWPLDASQIAVIGNGNVALDVARMLIKRPEDLMATDIPSHVYENLKKSPVTDVHVFGRRGPAQVKFSPLELREALHLEGVEAIVYEDDFQYDQGSMTAIESSNQVRVMVKTLEGLKENKQDPQKRRLHLHFFSSPTRVLDSQGRVSGLEIERTKLDGTGNVVPTGEFETFPIQALYRAVGYYGSPLAELPFDEKKGIIPNDGGRVLDDAGLQIPGIYCTGWIKRGPVGLIGHTKADAIETIGHVIDDKPMWLKPSRPGESQIIETLNKKAVRFVGWPGWLKIDSTERSLGENQGRERIKLFDRSEMLDISES